MSGTLEHVRWSIPVSAPRPTVQCTGAIQSSGARPPASLEEIRVPSFCLWTFWPGKVSFESTFDQNRMQLPERNGAEPDPHRMNCETSQRSHEAEAILVTAEGSFIAEKGRIWKLTTLNCTLSIASTL